MTDRPHVRVDPHVMGGSPVIDGTRIPTRTIAVIVADGTKPEKVAYWYPTLNRAQVLLACWHEARHTRGGGREMMAARRAWRDWATAWRPTHPQCPDPPEVTP